jgi:Ni/Co efflux regulator RcnB
MTRLKILGAAAILASALASPAMAQQAVDQGARNSGDHQRQATYRHDRNWNNSYNRSDNDRRADRDNRLSPGDAAAGVVGGAVATAGAIATAPFRAADAYAWDNGYNDYYGHGYGGRDWKTYAARNGLACTPGTWFKGEDGRRQLCQ